jgi:hypothetical protein
LRIFNPFKKAAGDTEGHSKNMSLGDENRVSFSNKQAMGMIRHFSML